MSVRIMNTRVKSKIIHTHLSIIEIEGSCVVARFWEETIKGVGKKEE
jgi:hypothetical protein